MLFESIFMIRGGTFGEDFGNKLIMSVIGLLLCFYDYKINDKRKDYFWVFLFGTLIWSGIELLLQFQGTRALQQKYFFGINVTNALWLTIPLQGMSEGAFVAVIGVFIGDRLLNVDKRKEGIISLAICLGLVSLILLRGINFTNVVCCKDVPSRRNMFTIGAVIFIILMCLIAVVWLLTTDSESRKRGLLMYLVMVVFIAVWTLNEWLTGQRWIEIGTIHSDGSYSGLRRAPAHIEFLALFYDVVVEVSLIYIPFLAIPYWLKLIRSEET